MPDISTIYDWFPKHPEFAEQYARAKQDSADALIEEINDIADNGTNDWMELHDPDNPGYKAHGEHIQRSRLRVDTKKWIASKMKPKKYGDVTNLNVAGPDGQPLSFTVNVTGK